MRRQKFNEGKKVLLSAAEKAIRRLNGKILYKDPISGVIEADMPGNFLSYGHEIRVTVKPTSDKMNTVSIVSKSTGIQVIDWGTNSETEENIIDKINSFLD